MLVCWGFFNSSLPVLC